jgi:citrate lyase subunit beta / citryl-CoA lyase
VTGGVGGAPRPRRSVLFTPALNARATAKLGQLAVDGFILDLEDSVAPAAKPEARAALVKTLAGGGFGRRERIARVNAMASPWGAEDLAAIAGAPLDGVLLPKIETPAEIAAARDILSRAGARADLALWLMIETPRAVLDCDALAGQPGVACLILGFEDLGKALGARALPGRAPMLTALSLVVLAARAHGRSVLDGVHVDIADDAGFEAAAVQARDYGCDGKTLVHPRTIEAANRIFSPSAAELDHARRLVAAHAEALARGQGIAVLDGAMVEQLHVARAKQLLATAAAIAELQG